MADRMHYVYDYLDGSYPDDLQAKMDARTEDGFSVSTAVLAHPYMFVLWERPWPGTGDEERPGPEGGKGMNPGPAGSRA